ncbi:HAD-IIIA family hydrolase [Skermanella mucosa]|uniref:HAD-IIIA family hydrolase n=1 Tax=Skermanella mucosa TaxID=1789672 RepID=UPI00192AC168|nr:HAD-IIIA family hydrolase [Skermanella mucosa]UEM18672.1 HAD-IIIA family hydrolase [Skermanella mucosa]
MLRQAILLVGGRSTRPGSLTETIPKPLNSVAGRPFLDWQIEEIARFGFARILLLAGYKGEQIVARYHDRIVRGAHVEVVVEPEPLGTAGALRVFQDQLDERFLLLNGDTLFSLNLLDLPLHAEEAMVTLALRHTAPSGRYGTIELSTNGRVQGLMPYSPDRIGPVSGGIYTIDRRITEWIGSGPVSLATDIFPRLASEGMLRGHIYDGAFIDIGVPEDLTRAQHEIPTMACRPAAFLDRDGVLIEDTGYPHDPAAARWIPGAMAAVKRLNDAGFYVFIVSNQAGVARGYYPESQVGVMHAWMAARLAEAGAHVDAYEYCPHHPEGTSVGFNRACYRRKPEPGMIKDLMATWIVNRNSSFLIGDKESDLAAAAAAGLPGYRFCGGDLAIFVDHILARAMPNRTPP